MESSAGPDGRRLNWPSRLIPRAGKFNMERGEAQFHWNGYEETKTMKRGWVLSLLVVCAAAPALFYTAGRAGEPVVVRHSDLLASVEVVEDSDGVPHILAQNDRDAVFVLGRLHARDRFFQMDAARRLFSGRLAELLGEPALESDIILRTIGLRRAAERSYAAYSAEMRSLLLAYSNGVNAYLQSGGFALPREYEALELTQVEEWTPLDSVTVAKGQAFALSFDQIDLELTAALEAYEAAGTEMGFDGRALLFQDLFRSAPFDSTVSIPTAAPAARSKVSTEALPSTRGLRPTTLKLARQVIRKWRENPFLRRLLATRESQGSNWWIIGGANTETGFPMLANDPHLSLDTPPIFYEAHLTVTDDPRNGALNVAGVSFAGTPLIAQGCNERICWGSTVNPMDVTDYYEEELVIDFLQMRPTHTVYQGTEEALVAIPQTFRVNQAGNGVTDDLIEADISPLEGGVTFVVPRRNGPIISADVSNLLEVTGVSVQFTGFSATRELDAFRRFSRAGTIEEFREGLQYFDVGSQNFAYADIDGNVAYFTSAELPLREDLQDLERVDGRAPFLIRDGTGANANEWKAVEARQLGQAVDYAVLPFSEMPQVVNPASGFILNANNDPVGTTLDNDVLNQLRPGGGIFYLSPGYASLRIGRIRRLVDGLLADGGTISLDEMMQMQANNQLLDAEVLTPYLLQAFENASTDGSNEGLLTLASDPQVAEAVQRLADWDFSTPTGIAQGYDPGDDPNALAAPNPQEISDSVAATIYALWRAAVIRNVIDSTLGRLGLEGMGPPTQLALSALLNLLENFDANQGVGLSGVDFFLGQEATTPAEARDLILLGSLRQALDLAASDQFAPAFQNSTDQSTYRWGYLHRIVFDHPLGGPFNLPDGMDFDDLAPDLPGVARAGGLGAVDASSHNARADGLNEFMFGSGPARRFVAELRPDGIRAYQIMPGGQSGELGSLRRDDQLGRWLTNGYHLLRLSAEDVQADVAGMLQFAPEDYQLFFPFFEGGEGTFTGFAVSNLLDSVRNLEFSFFNPDGELLEFPQNPAARDLDGLNQLAQLGSDLLGVPPGTRQSGWAQLTVTPAEEALQGPAVASFTQFGDFRLTRLDGGVAWTRVSQELYFTRVAEGPRGLRGRPAETVVSLANPGESEIELELRLAGENPLPGAPVSRTPGPPAIFLERTLRVPPLGIFRGTLTEIFGMEVAVSEGFLQARVTEGAGAVGFQLIRVPDSPTVLGLNASAGTGRLESFAAQLASGDNVFTEVSLLNTAEEARRVVLTAVGDDGRALAPEVEVTLAPATVLQRDAAELFDFGSGTAGTERMTVEGSMRVAADGDGIVGSVLFGDPRQLAYAAALTLQERRFRQAVFSQVANTPVFFTGLALLNPDSAEASVEIEVFDASGESVGAPGQITLQAGRRTAQLLTELVPESANQQGGYITVTSDRPIVAQQLFGTFRLSLLSAVPPTIVE